MTSRRDKQPGRAESDRPALAASPPSTAATVGSISLLQQLGDALATGQPTTAPPSRTQPGRGGGASQRNPTSVAAPRKGGIGAAANEARPLQPPAYPGAPATTAVAGARVDPTALDGTTALVWDALDPTPLIAGPLPDGFDPEEFGRTSEGGSVLRVAASDAVMELLDAWVSPCDAQSLKRNNTRMDDGTSQGLRLLPAVTAALYLRVREMVRSAALPQHHAHETIQLLLAPGTVGAPKPDLLRHVGATAIVRPPYQAQGRQSSDRDRQRFSISGARSAIWLELVVASIAAAARQQGDGWQTQAKSIWVGNTQAQAIVQRVRSAEGAAVFGAAPTLYRVTEGVRVALGLPQRCYLLLRTASLIVTNSTLHVDVVPLEPTDYALVRCHTDLHCERLEAVSRFLPMHTFVDRMPFRRQADPQACAHSCLLSLSPTTSCGSATRIAAQRLRQQPVVFALDDVTARSKDDAFAVEVVGDALHVTSFIVTPFKAEQIKPDTPLFDGEIFAVALRNGDDHYDGTGRKPMLPEPYASAGSFSRVHRLSGGSTGEASCPCCCAGAKRVRAAAAATRVFDAASGIPSEALIAAGEPEEEAPSVRHVGNMWIDDELVFPFLDLWHLMLREDPSLRAEEQRVPCGLTHTQQQMIRRILRCRGRDATLTVEHNTEVIQRGHAITDYFADYLDVPSVEVGGANAVTVSIRCEHGKRDGFLYRSGLRSPFATRLGDVESRVLRIIKSPMKAAVRDVCARQWGLHVVAVPSVAPDATAAQLEANRTLIEILRVRARAAIGATTTETTAPPRAILPVALHESCSDRVKDAVLRLWDAYVSCENLPSDAALSAPSDVDANILAAAAGIQAAWLCATAAAAGARAAKEKAKEKATTPEGNGRAAGVNTPTAPLLSADGTRVLLESSAGTMRLLAVALPSDRPSTMPLVPFASSLSVPPIDSAHTDAATRLRHDVDLIAVASPATAGQDDPVSEAARLRCAWDGSRPMRRLLDFTAQYLALRGGPRDAQEQANARQRVLEAIERAAAAEQTKSNESAAALGMYFSDPRLRPHERSAVPLVARIDAPNSDAARAYVTALDGILVELANTTPLPGAAAAAGVMPFGVVQLVARAVPASQTTQIDSALAAAAEAQSAMASAGGAAPAGFLIATDLVTVRATPGAPSPLYEFVVREPLRKDEAPTYRVAFVEFTLAASPKNPPAAAPGAAAAAMVMVAGSTQGAPAPAVDGRVAAAVEALGVPPAQFRMLLG